MLWFQIVSDQLKPQKVKFWLLVPGLLPSFPSYPPNRVERELLHAQHGAAGRSNQQKTIQTQRALGLKTGFLCVLFGQVLTLTEVKAGHYAND